MVKSTMNNKLASWDYIAIAPMGDTFTGKTIDPEHPPLVSFCIPTKNNPAKLRACLESIVQQDYPRIEIIVVINGSSDNSREVAKDFTDQVYSCDGSLGKVRQFSLGKSSGRIVALIDDDVVLPHKDWLAGSVSYFNYSDRVSTVWPLNIPPPEAPLTTKLYFNLWKLAMEDQLRRRRGLFGGGNALFRRECLEEIGGISTDIHWGEDYDWAKKLKGKGYQVVYSQDAIYHNTMDSLGQFIRKQFIGARTFSTTGFQLMNLSLRDVIYQQVMLGTQQMARGLIKDRDPSWALWPVFLMVRLLAYGYTYLRNSAAKVLRRNKLLTSEQNVKLKSNPK
jgi:cellulose synthase/poly-beta-1,6-N-acetylglucosamine synthase-like glycosyltransferase